MADQQAGFRESTLEQWRRDALETARAERRALEDAKADEAAVWALADFYVPSDIREFAARHRIPELAEHLWRTAFVLGWRAAHRARSTAPEEPHD